MNRRLVNFLTALLLLLCVAAVVLWVSPETGPRSVGAIVGMPDTLRALIFLTGGAAVLFAGVMAVGSGLIWYWWDRPEEIRRARRAQGRCATCGYDLTRSVSRVCPEMFSLL